MRYATSLLLFILLGLLVNISALAQEADVIPIPHVLVLDGGRSYDLQVTDLNSGAILYTSERPDFYDCPESLSPDGRWLVYGGSNNRPYNRELFVVDLQNGTETPLNQGSIMPIRWHDGNFVYMKTLQNGVNATSTVYRYHPASKSENILLEVSSPIKLEAVQWINNNLVYVTREGMELTIHQRANRPASFALINDHPYPMNLSATGRYLSYTWNSTPHIISGMVIDTQTGLEYTTTIWSGFVWFHQADKLAYIRADQQVIVYDPMSKAEQVFDLGGNEDNKLGGLKLSPDDRYLSVTFKDSGKAFHIINLVTGESQEITLQDQRWSYNLQWIDAERFIYLNADEIKAENPYQSNTDIWLYDLSTGNSTQVTDTPDLKEDLNCAWG